ncbi:YraN family protein [Grimontia sp. NTOU-MAR1]|uniref:YraN family protein n=1 Tax=Grimontia sp. NTOU-MAR1 TaxID=3111011 RepID=UPI002DB96211|nr:YraN family protein [Grimontia sp. NTOU-MAR1]WRV97047.1 YraN family protein [Grimontia sp. NTOU-MAR1]
MFQLSKKQTGDHYETQARRFLERQGLKTIEKNARFKGGELDLIMREKNCLVFVEVKYRNQISYGGAAASISKQKQQRMLKAAYLWLAKNGLSATHTEFRFDAVTFEGDVNSVNWMKNIVFEG